MLKYLLGTREWGIEFKGEKDCIECFPHASLGLNDEKGQSTTCYAVYLFGDLVSWQTKKQSHITLSSEAEFVAMSTASREISNIAKMCKRMLNVVVLYTMF